MKREKRSISDFEKLEEFEILDIGMQKGIIGGSFAGCGSDTDRLCFGLCPTAGCRHDGCCGSTSWDHRGDAACSNSGLEVAFLSVANKNLI